MLFNFVSAKQTQCDIPLLDNIKTIDKTLNDIDYNVVSCLLKSDYSNDLYLLSVLYFKGIIVEQDFLLGEKYLKISADKKHLRGTFDYGAFFLSKGEQKSAEFWFQQSADLGYAPAQTTLGVIYLYRNDTKSAYLWTKKAADQNDPIALLNLSKFYFDGIFVDKDIEKALSILTQSAEFGSDEAQFKLANIYYRNIVDGIKQDMSKAFYWMKKSADQGYSLAINNLSEFYLLGIATKKNPQEAYELIRKLAEKNYCYAQYNLASMYDYGFGVEQNNEKAVYWYTKMIDNVSKNDKILVNTSLLSKISFNMLSYCVPENMPVYFINIPKN